MDESVTIQEPEYHSTDHDMYDREIPGKVAKILLPDEQRPLITHYHWAMLMGQATITVSWFLGCVVATGAIHHPSTHTLLAIWMSMVGVLIWYGLECREYYCRWFIITHKRIISYYSFVGTHATPLPLMLVRDCEYHQSPLGRIAGFGTIKTQSFGTAHQLSSIPYVPNPEYIWSEIWARRLPYAEGNTRPGGDVVMW